MIGEFDIYGVYFPVFIVFAGLALLLQLAIKRLFDAGLITLGWQTVAWSGGQRDSRARQRGSANFSSVSAGTAVALCDPPAARWLL